MFRNLSASVRKCILTVLLFPRIMKTLRNSFVICASIFLTSSVTNANFSDLPETHPYHFALSYLAHENIINGYADGTVKPDQKINRAELLKILVEGLGYSPNTAAHKNCFPDVTTEWFAPYVCYALEKDWVTGYPDGSFKPEQNINKVEALKIILNAFAVPAENVRSLPFTDVATAEWFAGFLQAAVDKNVIEESAGAFQPAALRTRGEVAEMVARIKQIQYMDDLKYTDWIRAEFQTFLLLHKLREENGVTEKLVLDPRLTKAARAHAQDMAEVIGDMSHQSSDGRQSWDRIRAEIPDAPRTGENVGKGWFASGGDIFQGIKNVHDTIFMPEPDGECNHRTTILSTCLPFTTVGIGVYVQDNIAYFVEDFITSEYSKTLVGAEHLEVPDLYSDPKYNVIEGNDNDYTFTTVQGCEGKVRLQYFITSGIYMKDGDCVLYEFAFHIESNVYIGKMPDVPQYGALTFDYTSNIYGNTTIEFEEAYIAVRQMNGWEITSHPYPADFNIGEVVTITAQKDGAVITLQLDLSEQGWVTVSKLS